MKVIKLNTPYEICAVPRIALVLSDVLIFTARNETSSFIFEQTLNFSIINDRLKFTLTSPILDFKAGNKYEIFITTNGLIVYRGKMIIVKEDTNIQNYTPSNQTTPRFL